VARAEAARSSRDLRRWRSRPEGAAVLAFHHFHLQQFDGFTVSENPRWRSVETAARAVVRLGQDALSPSIAICLAVSSGIEARSCGKREIEEPRALVPSN